MAVYRPTFTDKKTGEMRRDRIGTHEVPLGQFTIKKLSLRLSLAIVACLLPITAEAARFTTWSLVGIGQDTVLDFQADAGKLGRQEVIAYTSAAVDHAPGGYDWGESYLGASQSSFFGSVLTASTRDTWETEGTFAEADIYWESAPLLVTSQYSGSGSIDLGSTCRNGDFGFCISSADDSGFMRIQFNELTRVWFHLNARSAGLEFSIEAWAEASFSGAIAGAFDENMNPVDFSYRNTPEPSAGLLLLSRISALLIERRRRRHINVTERGHRDDTGLDDSFSLY